MGGKGWRYKLGNNFVRPIEPINRLVQTQSKLLLATVNTFSIPKAHISKIIFFLVN